MSPLFEAKKVTKDFGGVRALNEVDIAIEPQEIFGLIGPNGAGKTTFFNVITGLDTVTQGEIFFKGERINDQKAFNITRKGIARTFQNIRLFHDLSVIENVMVGRHCRTRAGIIGAAFKTPKARREEAIIHAQALEYLTFFDDLADYADHRAGSLPYGQQRRLEIARAMATGPELLLLDEPAAGMNPQETQDLMALILKIRETGQTILLIEHDMRLVMGICDRIMVLNFGHKIAEGSPEAVQNNSQVIEAYLGVEE